MRHIPEWLLWFSYKPLARIGRDIENEVVREPMQFVRKSVESYHTNISTRYRGLAHLHKLNGTAQPSLALNRLQGAERLPFLMLPRKTMSMRDTLYQKVRH